VSRTRRADRDGSDGAHMLACMHATLRLRACRIVASKRVGHCITAIVIAGRFDPDVARRLDLVPVPLSPPLTLFHINHYYAAYWQAARGCTKQLDIPAAFPGEFPREAIVAELAAELIGQGPARFALIRTEYFGGIGEQWACVFTGANRESSENATINDALRVLGVVAQGKLDEFDTVGLAAHRSAPEYLARYVRLCDELGV
jgi:hypothetical protein